MNSLEDGTQLRGMNLSRMVKYHTCFHFLYCLPFLCQQGTPLVVPLCSARAWGITMQGCWFHTSMAQRQQYFQHIILEKINGKKLHKDTLFKKIRSLGPVFLPSLKSSMHHRLFEEIDFLEKIPCCFSVFDYSEHVLQLDF